jgi:HD-like signal output (HDOD) protein
MQSATHAKQQILMLKQLPPLSATAARLLEILSDDNCSLADLARVIGQDPAVTARILGVANSAYFGQTTPIHTVEEAIIRVLGLNMVKSLAFSIALSGVFDTAKCQGFDLGNYWFRCLATALLSRELCRHVEGYEQPDLDGVYLAGLLFDIGTLVLVHLFPGDYAKVIAQLLSTPAQDPGRLETELIGISSREAGAWLADRWHLPPVVVKVVALSTRDDSTCEVAAVSLAAERVNARIIQGRAASWESGNLPGLDETALAEIEAQCRLRDEELRSIADLMVK